jgi:pimeloyl-ACP methyl ester carboxylesterase
MPRPLPILFIHGFNGDPGDWTDGGFRQYLLEHGGLDPDLVRLFRYGVAEDGTYNNRGDLRPIAARLAGVGLSAKDRLTSSVDQLSADSIARGGPAQVTLIAHSLGGIISRYYLSRTTADEFGTLYRGHVGRLITIGSPHRGVDLLRLTKLAPRDSLPWRFIRLLEKLGLAPALPAEAVEAWEASLNQAQLAERAQVAPEMLPDSRVLLTDTPIYQQLAPDSPLLAELNRPGTLPADVEAHTFYGDIRIRTRVLLGQDGPALFDHVASFGDLAVPADSAREIPYARAMPHPHITEKVLEWTLRVAPPEDEARSLADYLPETQHGKLLSNRAVQDGVLSVLSG